MVLALLGILIFLINLPFGYMRSKVRKFSVYWFLSVHFPVPLVYLLRTYSGIEWQITTIR